MDLDPLRCASLTATCLVLSRGAAMRRRSRAGGEPTKAQRRKAEARKSRITPKAARPRSSSAAREETKVARLTDELNEARPSSKSSAARHLICDPSSIRSLSLPPAYAKQILHLSSNGQVISFILRRVTDILANSLNGSNGIQYRSGETLLRGELHLSEKWFTSPTSCLTRNILGQGQSSLRATGRCSASRFCERGFRSG